MFYSATSRCSTRSAVAHFVCLGLLLVVACALRFWNLDAKSLWLDEIITAIFTFGHRYADIPVGEVFSLDDLDTFFSWQGQHSCAFIAESLRTESTHPPLYFCLLHQWLGWLQGSSASLAWKLRSLSALAGVATIPVVYTLTRLAFSPRAGLMAAALMTVSPFAVYLSQEARHYTVPMLVVSLALLGFVQIQQDLFQRRTLRLWVWLGWIAINSLGFYLHYFFLLTFLAQSATLLGMAYWQRKTFPRLYWGILGLAMTEVLLSYSVWMPQLLAHSRHPATEWAKVEHIDGLVLLSILLRWLSGWISMLMVFPLENQPLLLRRGLGLLLLILALGCFWQIAKGLKVLWCQPRTRLFLISLFGFIGCIHLAYLMSLYGFDKDISRAFRYNFIFYPAAVALIGASLAHLPSHDAEQAWLKPLKAVVRLSPAQIRSSILGLGLLSSLFVILGLAFYKPYFPDQIVQRVQTTPPSPLLVVQEYDRPQDLAFGLSLALALQQRLQTAQNPVAAYWSFIPIGQLSTAPFLKAALGAQLLRQPFDVWSISDRHPVKWDWINFIPMGQIRDVGENPQPPLHLTSQTAPQESVSATCHDRQSTFELLGTTYRQYQCRPLGM